VVKSSIAEELYHFEQEVQACLWTLNQFEASLGDERVSCEVCYRDGVVAGYLLASLLGDMFEILQITVKPAYQRQGIATQLLTSCVAKARMMSCEKLVLEVRRSNETAIALYQKFGFKQDTIRKNYYPTKDGCREDALLMSLTC
jgi:ribosomal-protein-alanine acetyltransferase